MVHCFRPSGAKYTDHHIKFLEAFFKSEKEEETDLVITDPALTEGAQ